MIEDSAKSKAIARISGSNGDASNWDVNGFNLNMSHDISGWQSISTAPTDGTNVLVFGDVHMETIGRKKNVMGTAFYDAGTKEWHDPYAARYAIDWEPTHWMPLPLPPAGSDTTQGFKGG